MSRRTTLSIALFLLLAAVALPAPAAPPGNFAPDVFARAWDWLDRFWSPAAPAGRAEGRGTGRWIWAENGSCINPDGKPVGAGCSAAPLLSDGGSCIDPNGGAGCATFVIQAEGGSCIDPDGKPGAAGCAR
jgi:hypothetical protein